MTSSLTQYVLMAIFFGVIFALPVAWFALGIKSYGTGDYHQP
jgi:ABC-type Na+ efflux pump permease subunit